MPIHFRDAFVCDMNDALSIEDVYKMYAAYAGVLETEFRSLVENLSTGWTATAGTWAASGTGVAATSSGADIDIYWYDYELPSSYVLEFKVADVATADWTVVLRGDGDDNYYKMRIEAPSDVAFYKVVDGVESLLGDGWILTNESLAGPGTIRVAVSEKSFSTNEYDRWLFFTVWMDNKFLLSARDRIPDSIPGYYFGLAVQNGDAETRYYNLRVPDMAEIVPYATIDPDETAQGAIQRAIVDRVLKHFVRYNGALVAWRPKASSVMRVFTQHEQMRLAIQRDHREIANHIRLFYLLSWVDAFHDESIAVHGRRFREMNSAVIENEREAYLEAQAMIRRSLETARTASLNAPVGGFFIEPEDRVTFPDGNDYIVDSLDWSWQNGRIMVDINGRSYQFDE